MSVREVLWDVAVDQYGYVTSADAAQLGIPVVELGKLSARGGLARVAYGVYRFPTWPVSERDHLMEAVLWARDPAAALSHETALDVWELCDVNPDRTHVTIPARRPLRRTDTPAALVIHYQTLPDVERDWWEQIPTVTVPTAIRQGIEMGLRPSLIAQALGTGTARGLLAEADRAALQARLDLRMSA